MQYNSHGLNSLIQASPDNDEDFDGVDFQVEELENVGTFKAWTRLSVDSSSALAQAQHDDWVETCK
jgi:hypothetical protein